MSAEFIECFKSMIIKELRQSVGLLVGALSGANPSVRPPEIEIFFFDFFLRGWMTGMWRCNQSSDPVRLDAHVIGSIDASLERWWGYGEAERYFKCVNNDVILLKKCVCFPFGRDFYPLYIKYSSFSFSLFLSVYVLLLFDRDTEAVRTRTVVQTVGLHRIPFPSVFVHRSPVDSTRASQAGR